MTSAVTRPTNTAYPMVPTGRGSGRGTPAKSGVGLPYEGAVTLKSVAPPPPPRPAASAKPAAEVFNPYAPRRQYVLALTSDGKLHSLFVSNGDEPDPPVQFVPPNAHARGLISYGNFAYVATTNGCGGVDDGVWALNLATGKVSQWKSAEQRRRRNGRSRCGSRWHALCRSGVRNNGPGRAHSSTSRELQDGRRGIHVIPCGVRVQGKNLIAAATNDGRLHLLDAAALSTRLRSTESAPFSDPGFDSGSLASWQDSSGTRWILARGERRHRSLEGRGQGRGSLHSSPAWVSRDLVSPLPPGDRNGVVFALSSGEFRSKIRKSAPRSAPNAPPTLSCMLSIPPRGRSCGAAGIPLPRLYTAAALRRAGAGSTSPLTKARSTPLASRSNTKPLLMKR